MTTSSRSNQRPKRDTHEPCNIYFITDAHLPSAQPNSILELRSLLVEFLDVLDQEFQKHFDDKDVPVWKSMDALGVSAVCFLDSETLHPLFG